MRIDIKQQYEAIPRDGLSFKIDKFKDYLIFDELAEFFNEYNTKENSINKLKDLFNYYNESSFIFPNVKSESTSTP